MLSAPHGANSEDMNKNLAKSASGLPIVLPLRLYFCLFHRVTGRELIQKTRWSGCPIYAQAATIQYFSWTRD